MTLTYSGDFTPDNEAIIDINNKGQVMWIKIVDDNGNVVNLTDTSKVEIIFKHLTDTTISEIARECTKSDALNGLVYYCTNQTSNADFPKVGEYSCKSKVYWSATSDFPNGREIKAYRTFPDKITVIDK